MSKRKPITVWSVLALIVLVGLGGLTVLASWYSVRLWVQGGEKFVIEPSGRVRDQVYLSAGQHVVFYESFEALPTDYMMYIGPAEAPETAIPKNVIFNDDPFVQQNKFEHGGVQGKPVCTIEAPTEGWYEFTFYNSNTELDPNDRIVFGKSPATLEAALQRRTLISIGGLSVTGVLFIGLYLLHGLTLARRNAASATTHQPMGTMS